MNKYNFIIKANFSEFASIWIDFTTVFNLYFEKAFELWQLIPARENYIIIV